MDISTNCASMVANSFVATTHASRAGEVERNQSNLVARFKRYRASLDPNHEFSSLTRGRLKKSRGIGLLRSKSSVLQRTSKIRSRSWLRSPKRKSLVVNIRKPMSESFELIPKPKPPSTRLQSCPKEPWAPYARRRLDLA